MTDDKPAGSTPHVIYMKPGSKETLKKLRPLFGMSAGAIIRRIIDDFLAGDLEVDKEEFAKTSVWIERAKWAELRTKTKAAGIPISRVLEVGLEKLLGR